MSHYMMDIYYRLEGHVEPVIRERQRIAALDDAGAIFEAEALFAALMVDSPLTNFCLRRPGRKGDRIVYESVSKDPR